MHRSLAHPPQFTDVPFAADPVHPYVPAAFQRLRAQRPLTRRPGRKKPKIVHYIGSLGTGGAERQLVNLVCPLARRGFDVSVLTMKPLAGANAFGLPALTEGGVPARGIQRDADPSFAALRSIPHINELMVQLPNWLKPWPFEIARDLAHDPPDILHIWLDDTNIAGSIAGLMLGVPTIILSTRSVNPTRFPYMNIPWFQPWYSFLSTIPDLVFLNNSDAGRSDYAEWMNVEPGRFGVIRNGIDTEFYRTAPAEKVAAFRRELGLEPQHRLLTGVFRLSDEKRPLLFLDVAQAVMRDDPDLHTLIVGHGSMEAELRSYIAQSLCSSRIHLLPPRADIPVVYSASEVLLQTSVVEGTPNTLLEAQSTGCPVVTTPVGGAAECFLDGETGFAAETAEALADRVGRIVGNRELRARLAANGPKFVLEKYGMGRMVDAYVELYGAANSTRS